MLAIWLFTLSLVQPAAIAFGLLNVPLALGSRRRAVLLTPEEVIVRPLFGEPQRWLLREISTIEETNVAEAAMFGGILYRVPGILLTLSDGNTVALPFASAADRADALMRLRKSGQNTAHLVISEVAKQVDEDVVAAPTVGLHLNTRDKAGPNDNARWIAEMEGRELGQTRLAGNLQIHEVDAPCEVNRETRAGTIYRGSDVDGSDYQAGGGWHVVVCNWAIRRYQVELSGEVGRQFNVQMDQLAGLPERILRGHRVGDLHQSRRDRVGGSWDGQSERTGRKDQCAQRSNGFAGNLVIITERSPFFLWSSRD